LLDQAGQKNSASESASSRRDHWVMPCRVKGFFIVSDPGDAALLVEKAKWFETRGKLHEWKRSTHQVTWRTAWKRCQEASEPFVCLIFHGGSRGRKNRIPADAAQSACGKRSQQGIAFARDHLSSPTIRSSLGAAFRFSEEPAIPMPGSFERMVWTETFGRK